MLDLDIILKKEEKWETELSREQMRSDFLVGSAPSVNTSGMQDSGNDLTSTLLWPHLHQSLAFSLPHPHLLSVPVQKTSLSLHLKCNSVGVGEVHNRLRACHAFPDCQSPGSHSKVTFF